MKIVLHVDLMLVKRKMRSKELAEKLGLSTVEVSRIKTGKISAIRFSTLAAMCDILDCQPGDLLEYIADEND